MHVCCTKFRTELTTTLDFQFRKLSYIYTEVANEQKDVFISVKGKIIKIQ